MLPNCALPSVHEKRKAYRDRKECCSEQDIAEAEKSANFRRDGQAKKKTSFPELLLGSEFEAHDEEIESHAKDLTKAAEISQNQEQSNEHEHGNRDSTVVMDHRRYAKKNAGKGVSVIASSAKDWTCEDLSPELISKLEAVTSLTISVPRPNSVDHKVVLGSRTLRGTSSPNENGAMSWLDDNVIDGFMALVNARSERNAHVPNALHTPSKDTDMFNRRRVRTFIFSTQFFSIWNRELNGGYESVRKWRRKLPSYNSVGMFMFPAFVHGSHWVLCVVDIDGQQFLYYDPQGHSDNSGVMRCAKEWMDGEVRTASTGDCFKDLSISSWPVYYNPGRLPVQEDLQSCGVFVLYVAEHMERGKMPLFDQSDISALRMRTLLILSQDSLPTDSDSE